MRRFSTTASTVASRSRWSPAALFQQAPIEDIVELKTIKAVQRIAEQLPASTAPQTLLTGTDNSTAAQASSFAVWLTTYQAANDWTATTTVDKAAFDALVRDCVAFVQQAENDAWQQTQAIDISDEGDARADAPRVNALALKLARIKCASAASRFDALDKDQDGKVTVQAAQELLTVLASGNATEWLQTEFALADVDSDNKITLDESAQMLTAMLATQQQVMTELFALHVPNMPKKLDKVLAKSVRETNWNVKLPEKVRCVFHFADASPDDDDGENDVKKAYNTDKDSEHKKLEWDAFKQSQEAELEELDRIVAVYAKGFYDDRVVFYERKRDRRATRNKGLLLAAAIACVDYLAAVI